MAEDDNVIHFILHYTRDTVATFLTSASQQLCHSCKRVKV